MGIRRPCRGEIGFISGGCECLGESRRAEDVDDALEVVGHDGDTHFRPSACQASQQQARMAEDAVLERSEGVLDRGSPQPHRCRGRAGVPAVQRIVVDGAGDHSPCGLRA